MMHKEGVLDPHFEIWKTVKLGLHKSSKEYHIALKTDKCEICTNAWAMMEGIPISQEVVEVDLVRVTGHQAGFISRTRRDVIYDHFLGLGLQKCQAEVGPALLEEYKDQPVGEVIIVAMDPTTTGFGALGLLDVHCFWNGRGLGSQWGYPDGEFNPDTKWVFALPRKPA